MVMPPKKSSKFAQNQAPNALKSGPGLDSKRNTKLKPSRELDGFDDDMSTFNDGPHRSTRNQKGRVLSEVPAAEAPKRVRQPKSKPVNGSPADASTGGVDGRCMSDVAGEVGPEHTSRVVKLKASKRAIEDTTPTGRIATAHTASSPPQNDLSRPCVSVQSDTPRADGRLGVDAKQSQTLADGDSTAEVDAQGEANRSEQVPIVNHSAANNGFNVKTNVPAHTNSMSSFIQLPSINHEDVTTCSHVESEKPRCPLLCSASEKYKRERGAQVIAESDDEISRGAEHLRLGNVSSDDYKNAEVTYKKQQRCQLQYADLEDLDDEEDLELELEVVSDGEE
ncbi:hypothetical protein K439DRAFT_1616946 [Ramaria rubella]|nr:hypothetical protein K439DRAFT_1616946 [Ramaria rubella]